MMQGPFKSYRIGLAILLASVVVSGCSTTISEDFKQTELETDVIDEAGLNSIMLSAGNPDSAVAYFQRLVKENPERPELQSALALAMVRAGRPRQAALVYAELDKKGALNSADSENYIVSLSKIGNWEQVIEQIIDVKPSARTGRQHLMLALAFDHQKLWDDADESYALAVESAGKPEVAINNWGISLMGRGENKTALQYFRRALELRPGFKEAQANLVLATAIEGDYQLPVLSISEEENAVYLHNLGVIAMRRGNLDRAKELFQEAANRHPKHYFQAFEKLAQLENADVMTQ